MDVDWSALAGEAVTQMIKIFVPVLVVLVCKWIVEIYKELSEKNPMAAEIVAYAARLGYAAAEDYFRDLKTATGEDKMTYAIHRAAEYLSNAGISLGHDVLRDAITQYGVANYKFSWVKPTFDLMIDPPSDLKPDADDMEEEDDGEPIDADHMCVRYSNDDHHADNHENREQSDGSDQGIPADQEPK